MLSWTTISAFGQDAHTQEEGKENIESESKFDASTFIMDHIADSHEWHILTKKNGESVAIYLPVILYSKEKGLDLFCRRNLLTDMNIKVISLKKKVN